MSGKVIENKVINLVSYGPTYSTNSIPNVGDYTHWNIKSIVPCEKNDKGEYINLRTGKKVKPEGNQAEWPLLVGSVLHYKDDYNFLLSRTLDRKRLIFMQISDADIRPSTMYRINLRGN